MTKKKKSKTKKSSGKTKRRKGKKFGDSTRGNKGRGPIAAKGALADALGASTVDCSMFPLDRAS